MDCSPPGSSVHGILQARILEWVAISFSRGFSQPMALVSPELADRFFTTESPGKLHARVLSCFSRGWLFVALWTITHQAPQSMGFSRKEYWSGWPCPPGDLPDPGIEIESPVSPALQEDSLPLSHWGSPREAPDTINKTNQTKIVLSVFLLTLGVCESYEFTSNTRMMLLFEDHSEEIELLPDFSSIFSYFTPCSDLWFCRPDPCYFLSVPYS